MAREGQPNPWSGLGPWRRRGPTSNEEGLRALGAQIDALEESGGPSAVEAETNEPEYHPSQTVANEVGLGALGEAMHRSPSERLDRPGRHTNGHRRHRVRNVLLISLSVLLIVVVGAAGYAYYLAHDLKRVDVKGLSKALTSGREEGTENILMVGSTSRCALKVQNPAYGLCQGSADSPPVDGVNSDVIMILHADPIHHRLALLSIPRDLFIPNARAAGANKIDAGLDEGLTQLVAAIEEDFGIPIQHAVSLNFRSICQRG